MFPARKKKIFEYRAIFSSYFVPFHWKNSCVLFFWESFFCVLLLNKLWNMFLEKMQISTFSIIKNEVLKNKYMSIVSKMKTCLSHLWNITYSQTDSCEQAEVCANQNLCLEFKIQDGRLTSYSCTSLISPHWFNKK